MHWSVADEALLDSVRGDAARHVLNLTQEALANVLRHSGADRVEITCCMHKGEQALLLEVTDNGVGLREGSAAGLAARQLGKGLRGMQARAHQLGGQLMIESAPQRGTRVRALVPLSCLQTEEA
ncbi:MAG: histidine kinase, partial [Proteobacteria bacterium]|nr:histidine kinase [Pseudomonadota bacterium]